jgi:transglutaminase-like putative cysteine protease
MIIKIGFDIALRFNVATSILYTLRVHPSLRENLLMPEDFRIEPDVPAQEYIDVFGNHCGRIAADAGVIRFTNAATIRCSGELDEMPPDCEQQDIRELPVDTLPYLLPSRYCESDSELLSLAWGSFGHIRGGAARVSAICDFVYNYLTFDYLRARSNRSALETYREGTGVCRDFTHLAITLCRCMNIPAAYATGYLGDIGVPVAPGPMDFSAWFEAYLNGRWYTFDARHNMRRQGRILMGRGRDASDVALTTVFGIHSLERFDVTTGLVEA